MSVTFQAKIDLKSFPIKKVFVEDHYGLDSVTDASYFVNDPYVFLDEETKRFYVEIEEIGFTNEVNFSNSNFSHLLDIIDHNICVVSRHNDGCGQIKNEDIPSFKRKLIKAINTNNSNKCVDTVVDGNFIHIGVDEEYISRSLKSILEVVDNAQKLNLDLCWG